MKYAAIDFETATGARDSACSVAVVQVEDGVLTDSYYTLIRPPENKYQPFNIQIHGITPEDTADAPSFKAIWPQLRQQLEGRIVVAHNARFDMGVLAACLARFDVAEADFTYCDTVSIARKAWPDLINHKLNTVGDFLKIDFNHHNAMDDARTCAAIPLRAAEQVGLSKVKSLEELARKMGVSVCSFGGRGAYKA